MDGVAETFLLSLSLFILLTMIIYFFPFFRVVCGGRGVEVAAMVVVVRVEFFFLSFHLLSFPSK